MSESTIERATCPPTYIGASIVASLLGGFVIGIIAIYLGYRCEFAYLEGDDERAAQWGNLAKIFFGVTLIFDIFLWTGIFNWIFHA